MQDVGRFQALQEPLKEISASLITRPDFQPGSLSETAFDQINTELKALADCSVQEDADTLAALLAAVIALSKTFEDLSKLNGQILRAGRLNRTFKVSQNVAAKENTLLSRVEPLHNDLGAYLKTQVKNSGGGSDIPSDPEVVLKAALSQYAI